MDDPTPNQQPNIHASEGSSIANDGGIAASGGSAAVGGDVHGPVIVAGQGATVSVMLQGENLREKELLYLDNLIEQYKDWETKYTPLTGIAEVREAAQDGPRLDLSSPFMPQEFEILKAYGFGPEQKTKRVSVDDIRQTIAEYQRIILLGEPGSGKSTTLWRLVYDYATAARADAEQPLPVLVPLGGYNDEGPFEAHLARQLHVLEPYVKNYRLGKRLVLLLDGLNEMPQRNYEARVGRIAEALRPHPKETVVVTCRALDYVVKLEDLQAVEVSPLDPLRVRQFLYTYLGETAGEKLFWLLCFSDKIHEFELMLQAQGKTLEQFYTIDKSDEFLETLHEALLSAGHTPDLLELGYNPYMLLMLAQVYASEGTLPRNRALLFKAFVDVLLGREQQRHPDRWLEAETIQTGLAALAHAMQTEGGRGTTVERGQATTWLWEAVPGVDPERILYLASSATLLDSTEETVRFYHQLLQEYFAARHLEGEVITGQSIGDYWPAEQWWEPSGWEETTILRAGMLEDADALLTDLATVNPIVAARCLMEGEPQASSNARQQVVEALIARMTGTTDPPIARVQAGETLTKLGDPREEVMTVDAMQFCYVPAGPFMMDEWEELHEVNLDYDYWIGRYPVTVAQFAEFVADSGHEPENQNSLRDPQNQPVRYVTWYEGRKFCQWLTERWQGRLPVGWEVKLVSEAEWEKGARGGLKIPAEAVVGAIGEIGHLEMMANPEQERRYPWGDEADPNRANYNKTGLDRPNVAGCFAGGRTVYGCEEMSGNLWEWTRSLWGTDFNEPDFKYPYKLDGERENMGAGTDVLRVLRGGAFDSFYGVDVCVSYRSGDLPDNLDLNLGFRVVASPISR